VQFKLETLPGSILAITPFEPSSDGENVSVELDINTNQTLVNKVNDSFDNGHKKVILNIQNISYIDSSGLWAFDECNKKAKQNKAKLIITNAQPDVMRVFETVKFVGRLNLSDSIEMAIATFSNK